LGISLRERAPAACLPFWNALHDEELPALRARRYDAPAGDAARRLLDEHFAVHAGRRLRAFEFRDEWKKTVPLGVPA
ncbi:MAG: hypothetical protein NUW21_09795, partial [Elusimicrobia bacterium]|nr:hypothetical protein [Elusimicrobiota bacterium]